MDTEKQIKTIVLNRMERCSVCHHTFGEENIQIVSRRKNMWMMVVTCEECHAKNFVAAVMGDGDAEQAQLALRQLSREESDFDVLPDAEEPEEDLGPVTVDDLLEMHAFLDEFDGNFQQLFRRPR